MTTKKILLVGANGYVGRRFLERAGQKYTIVSIDSLLKPGELPDYIEHKDYRDLNETFLDDFDICLWVAGYSSVPLSKANPVDCYENNYSGLVEFVKKFKGLLIYASSGSVYANAAGAICSEETPIGRPENIYDFTKVSFDNYVKIMNKKYVGLRFGTVDGGSPRIREEVLLNRMIKDAMTDGIVNLANPSSEIFNLSSVNGNMETFVNLISKKLNSKIKRLTDSNAYDFQMTSEKFSNHYNYKFTDDLEIIVDNIINFYKNR